MNKLPVLSEGDADKAGEVFFVHRAQALTRVYGQITGLADAAGQETTGVFDGATKTAVQQVQASRGLATDGIVGKMTWNVLITGSAGHGIQRSDRARSRPDPRGGQQHAIASRPR